MDNLMHYIEPTGDKELDAIQFINLALGALEPLAQMRVIQYFLNKTQFQDAVTIGGSPNDK